MELLCLIREVCRFTSDYEARFQKAHQLCLNEGMVLCVLQSERLSSGAIAEQLGLTPSNASKVIGALEDKGMIVRVLGEVDKRQMYFTLSEEGAKRLHTIKKNNVEVPGNLRELTEKLMNLISK